MSLEGATSDQLRRWGIYVSLVLNKNKVIIGLHIGSGTGLEGVLQRAIGYDKDKAREHLEAHKDTYISVRFHGVLKHYICYRLLVKHASRRPDDA